MSESFSFLLLTVSAQQREEPACGRIPPPPACLGLTNVCCYEELDQPITQPGAGLSKHCLPHA